MRGSGSGAFTLDPSQRAGDPPGDGLMRFLDLGRDALDHRALLGRRPRSEPEDPARGGGDLLTRRNEVPRRHLALRASLFSPARRARSRAGSRATRVTSCTPATLP